MSYDSPHTQESIEALVMLPPLQAASFRWQAARERFGPEYRGCRPLVELYEELLDATNYVHLEMHSGNQNPLINMVAASLLHNLMQVNVLLQDALDQGEDLTTFVLPEGADIGEVFNQGLSDLPEDQ